jgi:tetratricopeptide (TPR) repeat protein
VPVTADEAERIIRGKVADQPPGSREHREALWELMRFLGVTGRPAEGLAILDGLLAGTADLEERAGIILAIGQLLERMGDYASALAAYSRGVALEPIGPSVSYLLHNNLGYCLNQLGRHAEAERWCRAAIEIDPLRHNAHKNLGLACQGQGRYGEAARSLIQAVRCEAGDPRALEHLQELAEAHPETVEEIPDLHEQLKACAAAVAAARLAPRQLLSGGSPEPRSS